MTDRHENRIIITGASGFVGGRVFEALRHDPREVICTSRNPDRARSPRPSCRWERLDVQRPETIDALLRAGDRVFYLIHAMSEGSGYAEREAEAARTFGRIARDRGVKRIVYLGGPEPEGKASPHLASRLLTGEILRNSGVPTVELRASMIVGHGSQSWRIARDLAARLPVMLIPRWLRNRSEPIAIDDVVAALLHALEIPADECGAYDLPGPEVMTFEEVLVRIAKLRGSKPWRLHVPLLSPRLSSYWLRLVTGTDMKVARELVEGLRSDLIADDEGFWKLMPDYNRTPFDVAAREALAEDGEELPLSASAAEELVRRVTSRA